jgi:hypothetical protein
MPERANETGEYIPLTYWLILQLLPTVSMERRRTVPAVRDPRNWHYWLFGIKISDDSASYDRGLSGALCPLWSVVPVCWRFEMWWQLATV